MSTFWFFNLLHSVMTALFTLFAILFIIVLYRIFKSFGKC